MKRRNEAKAAKPTTDCPARIAVLMVGARRFTIKGRVQGVWYRDSTRRVAQSLGLHGHAINLRDGDVEVFACGDAAALDELAAWLREGPPMARVAEVLTEDAEWVDPGSFEIA